MLRSDSVALTPSQRGPDVPYHDTYFVIAYRQWTRQVMSRVAGIAAVFRLILWLGGPVLRLVAAASVIVWSVAMAFALVPQYLLPLRAGDLRGS